MLEKDISHTFTDSVKKRFMELGFPSSTSGQLSKLIYPFKIDSVEKKILSRCDNFFYLEQIIKPYHEEIHDIVKQCWGDGFIFEIDNNIDNTQAPSGAVHSIVTKVKTPESPVKTNETETTIAAEPVTHLKTEEELRLFPNFQNFISCKSNADALLACKYMISKKDKTLGSLFIYGATGLGKTHLLQATGREFQSRYPNTRIAYLSAHDFVNEVIHKGIRLGKMEEIRTRYKTCDLLLVDDFEVFEKKSVCQTEFLHIFNAVLQRRKPVILSSSKPPKEFKYISGRLKSRILQGVLVELHMPSMEDRVNLLKIKVQERQLNLSDSQIECIANSLDTNIRELDGILNDIEFQQKLYSDKEKNKSKITDIIFKRVKTAESKKKYHLHHLQKIVSQYFDVDVTDLKSAKRAHHVSLARHIAIYIAKTILHFKTNEILTEFERKHAKIIFYSVAKITKLMEDNIEMRNHLESIKEKVL